MRWIVVLALAVLAGACDPYGQGGKSETQLLEAGIARRDRLALPPPVYCYRTLAEADCLAKPLAGESNRLIGAYTGAE